MSYRRLKKTDRFADGDEYLRKDNMEWYPITNHTWFEMLVAEFPGWKYRRLKERARTVRRNARTTSPMLEIALCLRSVFNIAISGGMGRYDNLAKKIDAVIEQLSA